MMQTLGRIVILVNDYDEAADFYRDKLGLDTLFDAGEGARRFLHLGFGQGGVWLLLADNAEARASRKPDRRSARRGGLYRRHSWRFRTACRQGREGRGNGPERRRIVPFSFP
ncbi:VOC family protein [Methylosinus sporium]